MTSTTKQRALALIARLPDGASWEDLMRAIRIGAAFDAGLADAAAGRCIPSTELHARLAERVMQEQAALRRRRG